MSLTLTILIKGVHDMKEESEGVDIFDHTGAVTLVKSDTLNILVDVGGRGRFPEIEKKLLEANLKPEDINIVILTHFHLDHAFNIGFFPNARVIGWVHEWKDGKTFRFNDIEGWSVAEGVHILSTPGHTAESLSVLLEMPDNQKVILAGDAINQKYIETKAVSKMVNDEAMYKKSAEKILVTANYIIPGHGELIHLN